MINIPFTKYKIGLCENISTERFEEIAVIIL